MLTKNHTLSDPQVRRMIFAVAANNTFGKSAQEFWVSVLDPLYEQLEQDWAGRPLSMEGFDMAAREALAALPREAA